MSKWEKRIQEQEDRKFWGQPVRYTTIEHWPQKMTYQEFLDYTQRWGVQNNLQEGEKFVEDWMEFFCAYHEIEQGYPEEDVIRNKAIDNAVETQLKWEEFQNKGVDK